MLRVTPLMLHHYCPLLWCDHVRVGKLSASPPPPLSLPLSEWVWRDHEPSFTQLLRCPVQVQDPEIISSKIIWASLKNTFTKQKIYSENSVPLRRRLITTFISQHTRVKILREGSALVVRRRHDRVRWCRVLAALTLCRPTLAWAGLHFLQCSLHTHRRRHQIYTIISASPHVNMDRGSAPIFLENFIVDVRYD